MKRTKFLPIVLLAFAALALAPPSDAQTIATARKPVNQANTTVSNDVGLLCKYIGTGAAATSTVAVDAATGDVTFLSGGAASTFECPVSGAPGGIIDVSDAACNTFGEVLDTINLDSDSDWRCVGLDVLRSDASTSTNGILITRAAVTGKVDGGVSLLVDSTEALITGRALVPPEARRLEFYCSDPGCRRLKPNPFAGTISQLVSASETITFAAGGPPLIQFIEVLPSTNNETVTTTYSVAGGATTVAGNVTDFIYQGFWFTPHTKPMIRVSGAAITTMTATRLIAVGNQFPYVSP